MTWAEIDLEKALWRIPAERSKNRRAHEVPLSAAAVAILKGLPRFTREKGATDFVFSPGDTAPSGFSRAKDRLDAAILEALRKAASERGEDPEEVEAPPAWTLHDIRRSAASGMAAIGVELHVVERCLNHVSGSFAGIVQVYQRHSFADEMRKALDAWARRLDAIVTGRAAANVVELKKKGQR